jgi:HEAT repeat protein
MTANENELGSMWEQVALGGVSDQEKIHAAWETGLARANRYRRDVENLLDDPEDQVRYYALQCLVLDLGQEDDDMQARCWQFLRLDPDEDVRAMAATCLGSIFQGSRSAEAFNSLEAELRNPAQSSYVKAAIFRTLFGIVGRPPAEWPGVLDKVRTFSGSEVEWARVASLKADLESPK